MRCDGCSAVVALEAGTFDDARRESSRAGWMDQARTGVRAAKWTWLCPACRPPDARGVMGRST